MNTENTKKLNVLIQTKITLWNVNWHLHLHVWASANCFPFLNVFITHSRCYATEVDWRYCLWPMPESKAFQVGNTINEIPLVFHNNRQHQPFDVTSYWPITTAQNKCLPLSALQKGYTWTSEMATVFLKTIHSTVSEQGGVVREPL